METLGQYRVATDNVSMISVAASADGRVFLGGADGNLYEMLYNAKDTWRQKKCVKVCRTKGIRAFLPSFIPSSLMGSPQPIVQVVVDDARHVLYTRSESSVLTVFDLGAGGSDPPAKVAETADFAVDASRALGGREVFRTWGRGQERCEGGTHGGRLTVSESQASPFDGDGGWAAGILVDLVSKERDDEHKRAT